METTLYLQIINPEDEYEEYEEYEKYCTSIEPRFVNDSYIISKIIKLDQKYPNDFFTEDDYESMNKGIEDFLEYKREDMAYELDEDLDESMTTYNIYLDMQKNMKKIVQDIKCVNFDHDIPIDQIRVFLENNPFLKSYKLVFRANDDLPVDLYNDIVSVFDNDIENIYFSVPDNSSLIPAVEYKKTIEKIDEIVEEVKKYDFSPLEKILYLYDIVKARVYTAEKEDEDSSLSRNINSALLGDKIVCVGYAKIFKLLLDKVGIESETTYLKEIKGIYGHVRNEIYIKDEKYDIDGVYLFDPTWDSNKNEKDNRYLLKYKYFGVTNREMAEIDEMRNLKSLDYPSGIKLFASQLTNDITDYSDPEKADNAIRTVNRMSYMIDNKILVRPKYYIFPKALQPDLSNLEEDVEKLFKKYNNPIMASTLVKALFNVRKLQYYSDPAKYPFEIDDFFTSILYSNWELQTNEERLLRSIFGEELSEKEKCEYAVYYLHKEDIPRKIKQVQFTKLLRDIKNNKERQRVK